MHFIVLAPNHWHGPWMNRQQLFSRIGLTHRVTYSTGPLYFWQRNSNAFEQAPLFSQRTYADNVTVFRPSKLMLRLPKVPLIDKAVRKQFARAIAADSTAQNTCLYLFHPEYADYISDIGHQKLVYHAYDDFSKQGDYSLLAEKELALLSKADVVFASSTLIQQRLATLSGRQDIVFLPNGVDYELFSRPQAVPDDLNAIPHPRVAYTGSINRKVDLELLLTLAKRLETVHFVLIGGIGKLDSSATVSALSALHNVHFAGAKPVNAIAAYMQHADINIMIYKADSSTWAISGYPLKLHEYLAVGKPVISAPLDAVIPFSSVLTLANSVDEWQSAIKQQLSALPEPAQVAARQAVARQNTWDIRVMQILNTPGLT
ncbi:glycosyltransferase [Rheinheimera sp.]|uniref:glycosyltransferase n=1 Tax=Rheinheimera sp. TaxID=1869214 RepID=UPI0027361168|nr:glycosyltransferase [Rheinheimera sp.]MDP2715860.1 glycosyltransferase [Rheinheimera sp.]